MFTHLSRNSFILVASHDDDLHVVVPQHLPEVNHGVRHWALSCDVPLAWVNSLNISHNKTRTMEHLFYILLLLFYHHTLAIFPTYNQPSPLY